MTEIIVVYACLCLVVGSLHALAFLQDIDPYPSLVMGLIFTFLAPLAVGINVVCALGSLLRLEIMEAGRMLLGASFMVISLVLDNIALGR